MANASGPAIDGWIPADFEHKASGIHYRIEEESGAVWLTYERTDPKRPLDGRVQLQYFLGSGRRGRTYLFEQQGYWFEAPINWYAKKHLWDMTPHYLSAQQMPLTLPVDPGCLHCHASGAAHSLPDARNHYAAEPFAAGGITCAACHGDAAEHLASRGKMRMLDLDTLQPARRDSICLNCHLEGQAAVAREGRRIEDFAPGDNLSDFTLFFVYRATDESGARATSQWEALLKSACKQKSGARMTCTTCHDPHGSPAPEERVEFYRGKCLQCHNSGAFAAKHHPENRDCTACHMARPPSNDIAHEQVTDHWIRKRVSNEPLPLATSGELVTVGGVPASDRDLGLAYAQMAARGDVEAGKRALQLLQRAETEDAQAGQDHELHAQLGFLEQVSGDTGEAVVEYRKALEDEPYDALAGGDLALIAAQRKDYADAIRLWQSVVQHDPTQARAALNLAIVECGEGKEAAALDVVERLQEFSPDEARAREMERRLKSGSLKCPSR